MRPPRHRPPAVSGEARSAPAGALPRRPRARGARYLAALDLGGGAVAPELAYVTARYAALVPFGKVAALPSELLPIAGARNAGTVRNRTLRVGEAVVRPHATGTAKRPVARAADPVVVG